MNDYAGMDNYNPMMTGAPRPRSSSESAATINTNSISCVDDTNTNKEVVLQCIAPYDQLRWRNIGQPKDGMAPDSVQYAQAIRPPYHLSSILRLKAQSTKGMSMTGRNVMAFVVIEGEVGVIIHRTQFVAKKGDSFFVPPLNTYNIINIAGKEAELSVMQYHCNQGGSQGPVMANAAIMLNINNMRVS